MSISSVSKPKPDQKVIEIIVNHREVKLRGPKHTGLEIKQAAIAQGVAIQLDFQLSVHKGKKWDVIDDAEPVNVNEHSEFRAVDSDDNS
jgi:hypothetical protein